MIDKMGKRSVLPKEKVICDECKEEVKGWFSVYIRPTRNFLCFQCYFYYLIGMNQVIMGTLIKIKEVDNNG